MGEIFTLSADALSAFLRTTPIFSSALCDLQTATFHVRVTGVKTAHFKIQKRWRCPLHVYGPSGVSIRLSVSVAAAVLVCVVVVQR